MSYFIDLVIVGLSLGMVYGLVAIGISLIYSGLDVVHFAHGEIYMLGAFIGLWVFNTFGPRLFYIPVDPWLPVAAAGLATVTGIVAAAVPARRAAALDPVEAIRHV